ncbi:MAG: hypothetical protein V8S98_11765 [Lachnospiraceae bacterium]
MKKIVKIITDKWKGWKYRKIGAAAAAVILVGAVILIYQGRTRAVECASGHSGCGRLLHRRRRDLFW